MTAIETFRAERFIFAFNRDLPGHAYEAAVSDDAGSARSIIRTAWSCWPAV